jgi:hypothetical protein
MRASGMVRRLWLMGTLLMLGAWSTAGAGTFAGTEVSRTGDTVRYSGYLTSKANAEAARLLRETPGARVLEITSPGGEIGLGIDLAAEVLRHGLDVHVLKGGCHSSCANYVFVAGRAKRIAPGALVLWHGSAIQADFVALMEGPGEGLSPTESHRRARLLQERKRQEILYQALGVDERVTIFGHDVACRCVWALSVEDMAAFGIRDVTAEESYPRIGPRLQKQRIARLRLADHPDYLAAKAP